MFMILVLVVVCMFSMQANAGRYEDFNVGKLSLNGVAVTATAAELNLNDGVTATTAEINAAADLSTRIVSTSKANGQAITLSASTPIVVVTSTGAASGATNTVTLATPYPLYQTFTITVASGSTNKVKIADSTTVLSLGSDWIGDATDSLTILTTATNKAVKVSASDN
jgi:hypothetical protein